eukprot:944796-Pleurochrysis_carterae.AAC.3
MMVGGRARTVEALGADMRQGAPRARLNSSRSPPLAAPCPPGAGGACQTSRRARRGSTSGAGLPEEMQHLNAELFEPSIMRALSSQNEEAFKLGRH